ncbi:hypothetical protein [Paracoccus sp. AS002]|uniref:hypothetical protein n=1 Tax=Paracoccus sp. AS002 TaxID=3019545 RepID=UPI0023E79253|nr:hypothetical protein [Paracoccus sp. AS002]MDF3904706.1 hypothetical protein [Paracoccus sp. AS002]
MRARYSFQAAAFGFFGWLLGHLAEGVLDHFGLSAWFGGQVGTMINFIFEPFGEHTPYFAAGVAGFVLSAFLHWATGRIDEYFARRVGVAKPFMKAYQSAAPAGIGKPVGKEMRGGLASWIRHQQASLIWIRSLNRIYQLPHDPKHGQVCYVHDGAPDTGGYHDEDRVRKLLNLPPNFNPPLGGVAYAWQQDPASWSWIGQCLSRVLLSGDALVIQHFENGLMMGGIPYRGGTAVVWLVEGGRWSIIADH